MFYWDMSVPLEQSAACQDPLSCDLSARLFQQALHAMHCPLLNVRFKALDMFYVHA